MTKLEALNFLKDYPREKQVFDLRFDNFGKINKTFGEIGLIVRNKITNEPLHRTTVRNILFRSYFLIKINSKGATR